MVNFPSPRYKTYEDASMDRIQANVMGYFQHMIKEMGFYQYQTLALLL